MTLVNKLCIGFLFLSFVFVTESSSQVEKENSKRVNFGYSTNPPVKAKEKNTANTIVTKKVGQKKQKTTISAEKNNSSAEIITTEVENEIDGTEKPNVDNKKVENVSIANKTREVAKKARMINLPQTEIYKVGIGDVLYINLQDTTAKYYTVLVDGTIDYPLAGKLVSVVDLTTDEIEDLLREKIKLYENPQINVKVREYVSHKIKVAGLAREGVHYLQREEMPLVVIKTMVGVTSNATKVIIKRENSEPVTLDLNDQGVNTFLIRKDDKLTFENDGFTSDMSSANASQFYFIGEKICAGGKQNFHKGITLVQAIFSACGGLDNKIGTLNIIRKTNSGKFISKKYELKAILDGKEDDPILMVNDMIDADK